MVVDGGRFLGFFFGCFDVSILSMLCVLCVWCVLIFFRLCGVLYGEVMCYCEG